MKGNANVDSAPYSVKQKHLRLTQEIRWKQGYFSALEMKGALQATWNRVHAHIANQSPVFFEGEGEAKRV